MFAGLHCATLLIVRNSLFEGSPCVVVGIMIHRIRIRQMHDRFIDLITRRFPRLKSAARIVVVTDREFQQPLVTNWIHLHCRNHIVNDFKAHCDKRSKDGKENCPNGGDRRKLVDDFKVIYLFWISVYELIMNSLFQSLLNSKTDDRFDESMKALSKDKMWLLHESMLAWTVNRSDMLKTRVASFAVRRAGIWNWENGITQNAVESCNK